MQLGLKWLMVRDSVILTPIITPVILGMDLEFAEAKQTGIVTSGKRDPMKQLRIIQDYAIANHIDGEFPLIKSTSMVLTARVIFGTQTVYWWQPAWSRLLNLGIIINPPLRAAQLFDQFRDGKYYSLAGTMIDPSEHFDGTCFDVGDGLDEDHTIEGELVVVRAALVKKLPGLKSITVERKQNCIHCVCEEVVV
jgi:hypothetical protein